MNNPHFISTMWSATNGTMNISSIQARFEYTRKMFSTLATKNFQLNAHILLVGVTHIIATSYQNKDALNCYLKMHKICFGMKFLSTQLGLRPSIHKNRTKNFICSQWLKQLHNTVKSPDWQTSRGHHAHGKIHHTGSARKSAPSFRPQGNLLLTGSQQHWTLFRMVQNRLLRHFPSSLRTKNWVLLSRWWEQGQFCPWFCRQFCRQFCRVCLWPKKISAFLVSFVLVRIVNGLCTLFTNQSVT